MKSKINVSFFKAYIELEKACEARLGVNKSGVSAYIARLVDLRFAPGRSEVLSKLIQYRKCRNAIAHEENAIDELKDLSKEDVKWVTKFTKSVNHKKDPVSRYYSQAKMYVIWKKVRIVLAILGVAAVGVGAYFVLNLLNII